MSNAIPVCFDCHAEIHHYNPRHPRGRRFTPQELQGHKEEWLRLCAEGRDRPEAGAKPVEAGTLERVLNELEFNSAIATSGALGALFEAVQWRRAIADGSVAWLPPAIRNPVSEAYVAMLRANTVIGGWSTMEGSRRADVHNSALKLVAAAKPLIIAAMDAVELWE